LKKVKSDQSSLFQHFKRSSKPKMTPPVLPASINDSSSTVCFIFIVVSNIYIFLLLKNTEVVSLSPSDIEIVEKPKKTAAWSEIFRPPTPPPLCSGHKERCVIRQVKDTSSVNRGRYFYVCSRADGAPGNPQARCDHFVWKEMKKKVTSTN
jgi:hypothetical protein